MGYKKITMKILRLSIKTKLLGLFFVATILCNSASADENWNLSIQGLRIIGGGYKNSTDEIMPFNQFKGSAISCLLNNQAYKIISFSDVESTILEFRDNLGTNLIDVNANFGNGFGFMRNISKDRSAFMFEILGSNLPANKATSLHTSGEIVIYVATEFNTLIIEDVPFSEGTILKTPVANIEIIKFDENKWGDLPIEVVLESNRNLSIVKDIKFLASNGQLIKSKFSASGSHNIVGDMSSLIFEKRFTLSSQPQKVNLEIEYWSDFRAKKIPYSISTSIGL